MNVLIENQRLEIPKTEFRSLPASSNVKLTL